jgi:hypothetical protein
MKNSVIAATIAIRASLVICPQSRFLAMMPESQEEESISLRIERSAECIDIAPVIRASSQGIWIADKFFLAGQCVAIQRDGK